MMVLMVRRQVEYSFQFSRSVVVLFLTCVPVWLFAIQMELDTAFNPSLTQQWSQVTGLTIAPTGQIYLGGDFDFVNGQPRHILARLNRDGSLDSTWLTLADRTYATPTALALDPQGRILVGSKTLTRLSSDGMKDYSFALQDTAMLAEDINAVAFDGERRILVGTRAHTYQPPTNQVVMMRFYEQGSWDRTFTCPFTAWSGINNIAALPDGKLLVSGSLTPLDSNSSRALFRLNSDGSLDPTFDASAVEENLSPPYTPFFHWPGQRILLGGYIPGADCDSVPAAVLLNAEGTLLEKLSPSAIEEVGMPVYVEPDGHVILSAPNNLARRRLDGSFDSAFGSGVFFLGGSIRSLTQILRQPDGAYVLAGDFVVGPDHIHRNLARLRPTSAPVPPILSKLRVSPDGAGALSFLTATGEVYAVQAADGVGPCSTAWQTITNLIGTGGFMEVVDRDAVVHPYRFYRLQAP